jgi:hypothetical protein
MQLNRLYTEENFKNQDLSQVICSICTDVIFDPATSANCAHVFCKECIEVVYKNDNKCPQCRIELKIQNSKLFETLFINKLTYTCNNKDCSESFKVGISCTNIIDHKKVCQNESITCPRCKENIVRKEMDSHKNKTICTDAYISTLEEKIKYLEQKYNHTDEKIDNKYMCIRAGGLIVRDRPAGPSVSYKQIGVIKYGDPFYVEGEVSGFFIIHYYGAHGYVIKTYDNMLTYSKV